MPSGAFIDTAFRPGGLAAQPPERRNGIPKPLFPAWHLGAAVQCAHLTIEDRSTARAPLQIAWVGRWIQRIQTGFGDCCLENAHG